MKESVSSPHEQFHQSVDERIRQIEAHHQSLEQRLKELHAQAYMTPDEQLEAAQIKKEKLKAKDELASLRRGGA